jgi:hypothetical protein
MFLHLKHLSRPGEEESGALVARELHERASTAFEKELQQLLVEKVASATVDDIFCHYQCDVL